MPPSGSGAFPTDGYTKRITFSDVLKCAQTAPVTSHSAQSTRAQTQTLCAQTPCAQKLTKKSKKVKFSKIKPPRAQLNPTPPAVAPSASEREDAKGKVIAELTRQSLTHCNQLGATATGPKFFVDAAILGNRVTMLVDSGSQVNILPASHCPQSVLDSLSPPPTLVTAYNGSAVRISGIFETDIEIGALKVVRSQIFVTSDSLRPILGTPALAPLTIDFKARTISDGSTKVNILTSDYPVPAQNFNLKTSPGPSPARTVGLYSVNSVVVPARSEMMVRVETDPNFNQYGLFTTEPLSCPVRTCLVAKSLARFSPLIKTTLVRVANPSTAPVTLNQRRHIVNASVVNAIRTTAPTQGQPDLKSVTIGNVGAPQKLKIEAILRKFSDVFASDVKALSSTDQVEFDIDTGTSQPVAQQKYRTPYYLRDEMRKIIDRNVTEGLMEPCSSPWAAPTLLVRKANGSWRLVCDYRRLNSVTTADSYPLPEINDCVNELAESKFFSTTDLCSGFHQIPTTLKARKKLAVTTDFGQYTWLRMPMGAKNCPSVFQRMMDKAFRSMPLSSLVIYLDDILLHSRTLEDHLVKLKDMFSILLANNLTIRPDKTYIATNEVDFCGFRIKNGTKFPNPDKVKAVRALPSPKSHKDAQSVFGLLNYFRSFIPEFAKKAHPITESYKAKGRFNWSSEAQNALSKLKNELCAATLSLRIPSVHKAHFVLETDASESGYAGALFICKESGRHERHGPNCLRPVEFCSGQFNAAQFNYYMPEKELFAGKESMKKWAHYLLGRPFTWHIDNAVLKWAHKNRSTKLRLSQWLAEISEFQAQIVLKPSAQMKVTDCLSRQFAEVNAIRLTKPEIRQLQDLDPTLKAARTHASNNRWPIRPGESLLSYKKLRKNLIFGSSGELLVKKGGVSMLAVPSSIVTDIIKTYHDDVGHPGAEKTIADVSKSYFWPSLKIDVTGFMSRLPNIEAKSKAKAGSAGTLRDAQTALRGHRV